MLVQCRWRWPNIKPPLVQRLTLNTDQWYRFCYISLEFYLTFLPMKLRTVFSRFRCRNHKLPVETVIYKNIPRYERVFVKYTQLEIGDEFHCPFFADQRRTYLPKYYNIHHSTPKCESIMNVKTQLRKLANFIKIILESVKWKKAVIDCVIMYTMISVILYILCNAFTVIFLYSSMWGLKHKHLTPLWHKTIGEQLHIYI